MTTHDRSEAERLSDRIPGLAEGRIVADDAAEVLARKLGLVGQVAQERENGTLLRIRANPRGSIDETLIPEIETTLEELEGYQVV